MLRRLTLLILKWLAILIGVGIAVLVIGYIVLQIEHNHPVTLPKPTGPLAVGRTSFDWVDPSRKETFGSTAGSPRELSAWVWYPADPAAGAEPGPYLPPAWEQARVQRIYGAAAFLIQSPHAVHDFAIDNAPLSSRQSTYPLIVFMPGLGPIPFDYTSLLEDLASRGYVVLTINPTYSSAITVFDDGRVIEGVPEANFPDNTSTLAENKTIGDKMIAVWAADDLFGLDQMTNLNNTPGNRFTGHLDLKSVAFAGHSFGGATAAQVCHLDTRCVSAANLDGYPYGDVTTAGLKQPFLYIQSELPQKSTIFSAQADRDVHSMARSSARGLILTIQGTKHFSFTDNAVFFSPYFRLIDALGTIDGARGLAITRAYLAAFFDETLKGNPSPLLDGPSAAYPEVTFTQP